MPRHSGSPGSPGDRPVVVDLGCGSGALGAAVLARRPDVEVWATDVDPVAVACARLNLAPEQVLVGAGFDALPAGLLGGVDVILANLPYVPSEEIAMMPPEARDHEHHLALDGGPDGLEHHRRLVPETTRWLAPGGCLLVECGVGQVDSLTGLMLAAGLVVEVEAEVEVETEAGMVTGFLPA